MADHFIFDGGNYKRGIDDGHERKPLSPVELTAVHRDPDLPHSQLDNAITGHFHMDRFEYLHKLAVDDSIYMALLPDALVYRGLWVMPQTCYPGMEFELELVDANEVHALHCAGESTATATTYGAKLEATMAVGLGDATCDAVDKAMMYSASYTDYRNADAFQGGMFDPFLAGLHKPMYLRMTITAMPDTIPVDGNCGSCDTTLGLPHTQWGLIIDDIGINKQLISDFCNCEKKFCAGCGPEKCADNC